MAPEQLEPLHAMPSSKSDVFAFGGFLIELFARVHPWRSHDVYQIKNKVLNGMLPDEIKLIKDPNMKNLSAQCMKLHPMDRVSMDAVHKFLSALNLNN